MQPAHGGPSDAATELGAGGRHDTERPDIETASDAYAQRRFQGAIGRWLLDEQSRTIADLLSHVGGARLRVLDVGGGHGQVTSLLVERGHEVVVHGSASHCFGRVRPMLCEHPESVSACVSNLWRLPFADRQFDLVLAVRLFGHVRRWRELMDEMARVTSRFMLIEFARAPTTVLGVLPGLGDLLFSLKQRFEKTTRPFFLYREDALVEELAMLGFRPVAVRAQFAVPMVLHRMGRSPRVSRAVENALRAGGLGARFRSPALILAERITTPTTHDNGSS